MKQGRLLSRLLIPVLLFGLVAASVPAAAADTAETLLGRMNQTTWITEGHGSHHLYVFFDPNCPYCHKLYEELRPHVKAGGLEVRWVPIGILMSTSLGKAAAILAAKQPIQAFYVNENDWNFGDTPYGGIEPIAHPPAPIAAQLDANAAVFNASGISGIPLTVFRGDDGKAYYFSGTPDPERLAQILEHVR